MIRSGTACLRAALIAGLVLVVVVGLEPIGRADSAAAEAAGTFGPLTTVYSAGEGGRLNDVVALEDGTTYVADGVAHVVRRIDAEGSVTVVAGSTVGSVFAGEGGAATSAVLPEPTAIAVAPDGTLYVGARDRTVRAVDPSTHTITTVLGLGILAGIQRGPLAGTSFPLQIPNAISVAPDGSLLVLDGVDSPSVYNRLVRLADGQAAQLSGGGVIQEGAGAVGYGWDSLMDLGGLTAAPDGRIWVVDSRGRIYSGTLATIESARRSLGWPFLDVTVLPGGDIAVGPVRLRADGSADQLLWASGLVPAWVEGYAMTTTRAVFRTPTTVYQRTIPELVSRPEPPTGTVGVRSGGGARSIATSGLTPTQSVSAVARPGLANPAPGMGDGTLGLYIDPGNVVVLDSTDAEVGWGTHVTVSVWTFDTATGTYSVPTSWSLANYLPITCSLAPTSRTVAYGSVLSLRARVVATQTTDPRSGVEGTWRIAQGGLTASSSAAALTSATGTTYRSLTVKRSTRVTYSVPTGIVGPCSVSVSYTVVPTLTTSLSATSVPRGAAFSAKAALTSPKAVSEPLVVQRKSGTSWVTVANGRTGSLGTKTFRIIAPSRTGTYYYRVVKPRTDAYGLRIGPWLKVVTR